MDFSPCTRNDPRCAALLERQAALYAQMRRVKSHAVDRDDISLHKTDLAETFARVREAA